MIETLNCANKLAGTASINTASNNKREIRILNHLAGSSFDCPIQRCGCGLRGVKGDELSYEDSTDPQPSLCKTTHFLEIQCRMLLEATV